MFKLVTTPDKEAAILAIPEICIDKIIALYHTSLFTGHQGVVKTYITYVNVLISNYTYKHITFKKGEYVRPIWNCL